MKGISGIIGGAILILVLIVVVSLVLASLRYLYGVQQLEMRQAISEVSQPHVSQISPWSVESSGELYATYVIYPNGKVEKINERVNGIRNFQNLLNDEHWAIIVFSNGQWVNVSNTWNAGYNGFGIFGAGSYLVPYYPHPLDPSNLSQLREFLMNGVSYAIPLYSPINITEPYNGIDFGTVTVNPSGSPVFGLGRILAVPVTSQSGWLNFTVTCFPYGTSVGFAIIVQNASGPLLDVIYFGFSYWPITEWHGDTGETLGYGFNFTYAVYQAWTGLSSQPPPGYDYIDYPYYYTFMDPGLYYNFSNGTSNGTWLLERLVGAASIPPSALNPDYDPIIKVAVKFAPGEPAVMYLWIGSYNGSGISWYKVILPTSEAPVGSNGTIVESLGCFNGYTITGGPSYTVAWPNVTCTWPVNLFTEAPSSNPYPGTTDIPANISLEPLVPRLGSTVEVVPYTQNMYAGALIFNVTYTI